MQQHDRQILDKAKTETEKTMETAVRHIDLAKAALIARELCITALR